MSQLASAATNGETAQQEELSGPPAANRHRLPDERAGITHHFSIAGHEGYLTVGLYPNGQPGEIFIRMAKEGSTIAGLMECFGTVVSVSLQHGVPLKVLCDKLSHTRFEPSGWTGNEELGYAKSIMDYLFRWMELRFLSGKQLALFTQQMAVMERLGSEEANQANASVSQYLQDSYEVWRCAARCHLWVTDGPQRQLPQVRKLWWYEWLLVIAERGSSPLLHQVSLESQVHKVCVRSILF